MRIELVHIAILVFANYTASTYADKIDLWSSKNMAWLQYGILNHISEFSFTFCNISEKLKT